MSNLTRNKYQNLFHPTVRNLTDLTTMNSAKARQSNILQKCA